MRGFLTSSIGVTCATALALPLTLPAATASAATAPPTAANASTAVTAIPGSTRSLPLAPLTDRRVLGIAPLQGLYRPDGEHFSLLGVVWTDPDTELHGRVQVRTRSATTGEWSGWQDIETHNADHGPDPGAAESAARGVRGATAPLWVGDAKGLDIRVRADDADPGGARTGGPGPSRPAKPSHPARPAKPPLPAGLRLELVDPGKEAPSEGAPADTPRTGLDTDTDAAQAAQAANTDIARFGALAIPALGKRATERELVRLRGHVKGKPHIGPRPRIVTRRGWGADETLRYGGFAYTKKVKAVFVHHTASGNKYSCSQAPSVIRSIYRYHVTSMGWRDIGYNFLVDKCGTIYEGRAGGVTKAVLGAHTLGFNNNSMGIAVIGTYGTTKPSGAAVKAIARLTAWKLGLYGVNPRGKTYLTSAGGNRYAKGKKVRLNVISGHRDGFATECPGKRLYAKLGTARSGAARYQGR
ncbi:peptidoglycan recognition protein [Streptomyces sp. IMTB 2501]|uniref:peptidoglycan recognition protein family protein n=1 Tax=Streptomyces sp. IMTB 2501 TaxID=1776340 RepID=UPI00211690D5|nr:peptidoglycan recognition protein [Streptomyces sp. IMTB 2501]